MNIAFQKGNTVFRNSFSRGDERILLTDSFEVNKKCVEYEKLVYLFRGDDGNMQFGMQSHGIKKNRLCRLGLPMHNA